MGNSGYGKTITNQLKHKNVEHCSDAKASRQVNTPLFRKLDDVTEDTWLKWSCKKSIKSYRFKSIFCVPVCQTSYATILLWFFGQVFRSCKFSNVWDGYRFSLYGSFWGQCRKFGQSRKIAEFEQDKCNRFPRTIGLNVRRMIREPQVFSRLSGKVKEWLGCVPKPITILGERQVFLQRCQNENIMTLAKRNIYSVTHEKK